MFILANSIRIKRFCLGAVIATLSLATGVAQAALTPFQADVRTAIDNGLNYITTSYGWAGGTGDGTGLALEALLEKRSSGVPTDPPQGYNNASVADQGRMRTAATYIINQTNSNGNSFGAYRDGSRMFSLALYALTGGPDKTTLGTTITIKQAMDRLADRTLGMQRTATGSPAPYNQPAYAAAIERGYWCYTNSGCKDASTTQFAAAGLNAANVFYASGKSTVDSGPFDDAVRQPKVAAALALVKTAYELNAGATGSDNGSCNVLSATERGHGYQPPNVGYKPSLQQTASGVYIQLFGGANVNSPNVQAYMEWMKNRYRYTDLDNMGNSWPTLSHTYYLWSSFKGMELMRQQGIIKNVGNIGPDDLGTLPTANAPACVMREVNKVPAAVAQPAIFGGAAAGIYSAEPKSQYFDYASQLLAMQRANGDFYGAGYTGQWENVSHMSYALLVLQRATGNPVIKCDVNEDGRIDMLDINLIRSGIGSVPRVNDTRDANSDGAITLIDARTCALRCTAAGCAVAP